MNPKIAVVAVALTLTATAALAHPGHGQEAASHWHATDAVGWLAAAIAAIAAVWWIRRK